MISIFQETSAIVDEHRRLNEQAMIAVHAFGYNGFKRLHRYNAELFECWKLKLANEAFDRLRQKLSIDERPYEYYPTSMKDHLAMWDAKLFADIKAFGDLNRRYFDKCGRTNETIDEALCHMAKNYEKTGRWYRRGEETSWLTHDMHIVDDFLHEKMKRKEKKRKGERTDVYEV